MQQINTQIDKSLCAEEKRNYGIDFLKIISAFMVVVLHVLGQGGVLSACENGSLKWYIAWALEIASYGAVNCFALTTGYLMVNKKYKTSRIIALWLEVVFYNLIITLVMNILFPQQVGIKLWVQSLFPVIFKMYWYLSAYFALFLLMPFINRLYRNITAKESLILLIIGGILFSIFSTYKDPFVVNGGYSTLWLIVLYCFGAHVKKFGLFNNVKKRWFAIFYCVGVILTILSVFVIKFITNKIWGRDRLVFLLVSYVSPTVVFSSVSLFMFCARLEFNNLLSKKILTFLSPLSFGIYIFHSHDFFYDKLLLNSFSFLGSSNILVLIGVVLGSSIAICLACGVVVYLRSLLFELCKINKFANSFGDKIDDFIRKKLNFNEETKI